MGGDGSRGKMLPLSKRSAVSTVRPQHSSFLHSFYFPSACACHWKYALIYNNNSSNNLVSLILHIWKWRDREAQCVEAGSTNWGWDRGAPFSKSLFMTRPNCKIPTCNCYLILFIKHDYNFSRKPHAVFWGPGILTVPQSHLHCLLRSTRKFGWPFLNWQLSWGTPEPFFTSH